METASQFQVVSKSTPSLFIMSQLSQGVYNRAKKNPIWDHFTMDILQDHLATCNYCQQKISRGKPGGAAKGRTTTSMDRHLASKHKEEFKEFEASKNVVKAFAEISEVEDLDDSSQSSQSCRDTIFKRGNKDTRAKMVVSTIPGFIEKFEKWKVGSKENKEGQRLLMEWLILDKMPWRVVDKPGLHRLLSVIAPKFELMTEKFYRDNLDDLKNLGVEGCHLPSSVVSNFN